MHGTHAATSKVESSAQGLSCQLKFVHAFKVHAHWQSFWSNRDAKLQTFLPDPTCLGRQRNDPICVVLPKASKVA